MQFGKQQIKSFDKNKEIPIDGTNKIFTVFTQLSARGAHLIWVLKGGRLFQGGALSREALIEYIKKISKYFQLVS